jgi:hypothetical protein
MEGAMSANLRATASKATLNVLATAVSVLATGVAGCMLMLAVVPAEAAVLAPVFNITPGAIIGVDPNTGNPIVFYVFELGQTTHFNDDVLMTNPNAVPALTSITATLKPLGPDFTDKVVKVTPTTGGSGNCLSNPSTNPLGDGTFCMLSFDLLISPTDFDHNVGFTDVTVNGELMINGAFSPVGSVQFEVLVMDLPGGAPEPTTWAMMLLGFAGLGYMGYRRTSKLPSIWSAPTAATTRSAR